MIHPVTLWYHTFAFFLLQQAWTSTSRYSRDTQRAFYHLVHFFLVFLKINQMLSQVKEVYNSGLSTPHLISTWTRLLSSSQALKECKGLCHVPTQRMAKLYHCWMSTSHLWLASTLTLHQFLPASFIRVHICKKAGSRCGKKVTVYASLQPPPVEAGSTAMWWWNGLKACSIPLHMILPVAVMIHAFPSLTVLNYTPKSISMRPFGLITLLSFSFQQRWATYSNLLRLNFFNTVKAVYHWQLDAYQLGNPLYFFRELTKGMFWSRHQRVWHFIPNSRSLEEIRPVSFWPVITGIESKCWALLPLRLSLGTLLPPTKNII